MAAFLRVGSKAYAQWRGGQWPSTLWMRGHSGMVRKDQTRNLEIPGSMLRIAPE
jgi:D-alanyl-D-alanine dipeptidase